MQLRFLGAAGTVTGSKYLLNINNKTILVDSGLYQGVKNYRERNWAKLPIDESQIDAIVLTHAHIDHSGYLPVLYRNGYRGAIFCSHGTFKLCEILLPDAGYLQEEDAKYANDNRFSKHHPAEPLYTVDDAKACLNLFTPVDFHQHTEIADGVFLTLRHAGHILGASTVELGNQQDNIIFSGDLGRHDDIIMRAPEPIPACNTLVVESTYGDRRHHPIDSLEFLANAINATLKRGGIFLMPAFAVGRAQLMLHLIQELKQAALIPNIPVYLNSPMAIKATSVYNHFNKEHKLTPEQCKAIDDGTEYVKTMEQSTLLISKVMPAIIISASGMATGGRVLHHLKNLLPNDKNTIAFLGFQAAGTRGEALVNGATRIKLHGEYVPVKAEILALDNFSAHGDYQDIIDWLKQAEQLPKKIFITHGEPTASDAMRCHLKEQLGIDACVAEYLQEVEL